MLVTVTGKHIDIGEDLQRRIEARLIRGVSKYFDGAIEAHVAFSHEGPGYRIRISVRVGKGIVMESHADGTDIYQSFSAAAGHMEKQLRRHKRRLRDHHKGSEAAGLGGGV